MDRWNSGFRGVCRFCCTFLSAVNQVSVSRKRRTVRLLTWMHVRCSLLLCECLCVSVSVGLIPWVGLSCSPTCKSKCGSTVSAQTYRGVHTNSQVEGQAFVTQAWEERVFICSGMFVLPIAVQSQHSELNIRRGLDAFSFFSVLPSYSTALLHMDSGRCACVCILTHYSLVLNLTLPCLKLTHSLTNI